MFSKNGKSIMPKNIVVAVDGPAGSGKSSVSRDVAKRSGMQYIDSGALYRAITLYAIEKHGSSFTEHDVCILLSDIELLQVFNDNGSCTTYCNGADVSGSIRSELVAEHIGKVSDIVAVREYVNGLMRQWAKDHSIIVDGRDIGTVVFPDADIKIYVDASVDKRAERRAGEYAQKGIAYDSSQLKKQIALRDEQDMKRPFGALRKAEGAVYLDTSFMTQDEAGNFIYSLLTAVINQEKQRRV